MRDELYNHIYNYAKTYIKSNSLYSPEVLKNSPSQSNIFPLVIIPECTMVIDDETLKHGEIRYRIGFDIEIYAIDKTINNKKVSKRTIISELLKLIYEVFEDHYGLLGREPKFRPNADINISRLGIEFTGKYKNNIFYRR